MPIEEERLRLGIDTVGMASVFKRRNDLNEFLKSEGIARYIGESVETLVPALLEPYARRLRIAYGVLEQSLFGLLGHQSKGYPTLQACKKANWILASNVDELRAGHPLSPFTKVHRKEWAPFALVDAYPDLSYRGHKGYTALFLSMAGYTATEEFRRFMPSKGLFKHIHLGMFSLPRFKYEGLKLPEAYVGMWTWVLLDPGLKWDVFSRAECSPTFEEHNRTLLNDRALLCLYGYKSKCEVCPIGTENCERATHRGMLIQKACGHCNTISLFRKDEPEEPRCIYCKRHDFLSRKKAAIRYRREEDGDEHQAEG